MIRDDKCSGNAQKKSEKRKFERKKNWKKRRKKKEWIVVGNWKVKECVDVKDCYVELLVEMPN